MNKTKITDVKTTVMNALLSDLRILKLFGMDGYKNTSQYMGRHIFPYLNGDDGSCCTGTYIYFDAIEKDDGYKIIFEIKAHKDISCCIPNNLDKAECYIKEDMAETFGLHSPYHISPSTCRGRYIEKRIEFLVNKAEG